jgi:hypothetical protein
MDRNGKGLGEPVPDAGGAGTVFVRGKNVRRAARRGALFAALLGLANGLMTGSAAGLPFSWSAPVLVDPHSQLTEVTCPTTRFCIGVDRDGRIVTSRNPAGGRHSWSTPLSIDKNGLDGLPNALSCPSEKLCVGVDNSSNVITSTNPMGGKRAWSKPVEIDSQAWTTGVSCPSARLCVAVTAAAEGPASGGGVLVSTHPTGGRHAWSRRVHLDDTVLDKIDCPTTTLCIAADPLGFGVTSTHPGAARRAWGSLFAIDSFVTPLAPPANGEDAATDLTCASTSLCAEVDSHGNIVTSTNPAGGGMTWSAAVPVYARALEGVSCPSTGFCVAVGEGGYVVASSSPTGESIAWSEPAKIAPTTLTGISCPSTTLCVAIDSHGVVVGQA